MGHLRMHLIGAVDGHIAVALDQHPLSCGRHRVGRQALALQVQQDGAVLTGVHQIEGKVLARTATRIGVDLRVHQLRHAGLPVAHREQGLAACGGHQLAANHQQAVFMARKATFHQHLTAVPPRHGPGGHHLVTGVQVEADAASMVAVDRLDHHRQANLLSRFPGRFRAGSCLSLRDRYADRLQQAIGQVLVAGDGLADGTGAFGLCRPDAALAGAKPQLDQVAIGQPQVGNAAVGGRRNDRCGARPQETGVDLLAHGLHGGGHVEGLLVDHRHQQRMALSQCAAAHPLVTGAKHHAVDAAAGGAARLTEAGGHARQVEQLNDHMLQNVAHPGTLLQPLQESARFTDPALVLLQRRQPLAQPIGESGQLVGGVVLQLAQVQPGFQHRSISPDVGAAQVGDAQELDVVLRLAHRRVAGLRAAVFHISRGTVWAGSSDRIACECPGFSRRNPLMTRPIQRP